VLNKAPLTDLGHNQGVVRIIAQAEWRREGNGPMKMLLGPWRRGVRRQKKWWAASQRAV